MRYCVWLQTADYTTRHNYPNLSLDTEGAPEGTLGLITTDNGGNQKPFGLLEDLG